MADKTIPQLSEVTNIDNTTSYFVVDDGIETRKTRKENILSRTVLKVAFADSPITALKERVYEVDTTLGAVSVQLPAAFNGFRFTIKDRGGRLTTNAISVLPVATELIEGLNATYVCDSDYGVWNFICDGTDWFVN